MQRTGEELEATSADVMTHKTDWGRVTCMQSSHGFVQAGERK